MSTFWTNPNIQAGRPIQGATGGFSTFQNGQSVMVDPNGVITPYYQQQSFNNVPQLNQEQLNNLANSQNFSNKMQAWGNIAQMGLGAAGAIASWDQNKWARRQARRERQDSLNMYNDQNRKQVQDYNRSLDFRSQTMFGRDEAAKAAYMEKWGMKHKDIS